MTYYLDLPSLDLDNGLLQLLLAIILGVLLILLVFLIFRTIYRWILFKKIGREGWESIIPIYNRIIEIETLNIPIWFVFLLFIPPFTLAVNIIIAINTGKKFQKDTGFIVGLILLPIIFYPILAFGSSTFNKDINGLFDNNNNRSNNKYCYNCGEKVVGNYCSKCGKKI